MPARGLAWHVLPVRFAGERRHDPGGALTRLSRDFQHIVADFLGVPANLLSDRALISGLVVAAASAAGMNASGLPMMRDRKAGGLTAALLHDDCHITVHAVPERELLLVDVLAPRTIDASRAIDVFARRVKARHVHREVRDRA
jgi:S-adenosylmethionine decarboxylase